MWSERRVPCSNQTGGGLLNRLQPIHQSFRDAEEQRVVAVQATGDERLCHDQINESKSGSMSG